MSKLGKNLIEALQEAASATNIEKHKLCWECNKKFRGKSKYPKIVANGHTVYVHKQCVNLK